MESDAEIIENQIKVFKKQLKIKRLEEKIDKALHFGTIKNLKPKDCICVFLGGFYNTGRMVEVNFIADDIIYLNFWDKTYRFCLNSCKVWRLDTTRPENKITNTLKNWKEKNNDICIEFPIFNVSKKIKPKQCDIPETFLCYDIEKEEVCPFLGEHMSRDFNCGFIKRAIDFSDVNEKCCKSFIE